MSTKKQRVDSVIADLKSKKISSHRLYQINLSRTEKKAKLARENYAKSKKRKFSYQKPPSGVKLDNIINEVSSSDPNKKIRNKEKKLQVQFNFRRKKSFEKERKRKQKPLSQGQKKMRQKLQMKSFQ